MKNILTFIAGLGIGVAVSWSFHKNKYEQMVQEEVESLRDMKSKKEEPVENDTDTKEEDVEEIDNSAEETYEDHLNQVKTIINYNGYSKKDEIEKDDSSVDKPNNPIFIITPEEFASQLGYDTDTFYCFEDDIITNDNNEVVTNVKEVLGFTVEEIRKQYGVYEDDAVYIRNERIQMDYEILRDLDTFKKRNGE
jgi:hypothetical protein